MTLASIHFSVVKTTTTQSSPSAGSGSTAAPTEGGVAGCEVVPPGGLTAPGEGLATLAVEPLAVADLAGSCGLPVPRVRSLAAHADSTMTSRQLAPPRSDDVVRMAIILAGPCAIGLVEGDSLIACHDHGWPRLLPSVVEQSTARRPDPADGRRAHRCEALATYGCGYRSTKSNLTQEPRARSRTRLAAALPSDATPRPTR